MMDIKNRYLSCIVNNDIISILNHLNYYLLYDLNYIHWTYFHGIGNAIIVYMILYLQIIYAK